MYLNSFVIAKSIGFTGTSKAPGMDIVQIAKVTELLRVKLHEGFRFLHHGDCVQADEQCHQIARTLGYQIIGHPPVHNEHRAYCHFDYAFPAASYLYRNHSIVDNSAFLIAAPCAPFVEILRSGTWATVRYARKQHKPIFLMIPPTTQL